jgi:hypothetical protein
MMTSGFSRWWLAGVLAFCPAASLIAQQPASDAPAAKPPVTATNAVSDAEIAKSNNPLADLNSLNFHNYYSPSLYGIPDAGANVMNLRGVMVAGRQIIRATMPISTTPVGQG